MDVPNQRRQVILRAPGWPDADPENPQGPEDPVGPDKQVIVLPAGLRR